MAKPKIRIIDTAKDWKAQLNQSEFYTPFHTFAYMKAVKSVITHGKWLMLKLDEETWIPLFKYNTLSGIKHVSTPLCEYGGAVSKDKYSVKSIVELLAESEIAGMNFSARFHPFLFKDNNAVDNKLHIDNSLNSHVLTLDTRENNLVKMFRKTTRHSIRYSMDNGLIAKNLESKTEIKQFHKLYALTMRKNRTLIKPLKFFLACKKEFKENFEITGAFKGTKLVNAIAIFKLPERNYAAYSYSATDYEYSKMHANYFLLWNKILELKDGYKYFDFGGTRAGSPLAVFKRGWGCKEYPLTAISTSKPSDMAGSKLRNALGVMPVLANRVLSSAFYRFI